MSARRRAGEAGALLLLLSAMGLHFWLNTKITLYSDDYWYGTFLDQGWQSFWRQMVEHYRTFNGRFYVHLIVPLVLRFDTRLFAVISPAILAALFGFGAKLLREDISRGELLLSMGLGVLCTLACDVMYLRMSLLWVAAFFNYVFPLGMAAAAAVLQRRWANGRQGRGALALGLLVSVLAGAATEQCALMALVLSLGYGILSRLKGEAKGLRCWLYPLFIFLGFLTILLAPGSWARVDRGVEGGFLSFLHPSVFAARFLDAMGYVVKYPSTVVLLAAVGLLSGGTGLAEKKKALLPGFPLAALQVLCFLTGWQTAACVLACLSTVYLGLVLAWDDGHRTEGLMLLAHSASNLMLVITSLATERTAFEGVLALILVMLSLGLQLWKRLPGRWRLLPVALLTIVTVLAYVPTLRGYAAVRAVVDENLRSLEESKNTGVCYYSVDMDPRYRYTMPFESAAYYDNFRIYYHVPQDAAIVFTSAERILTPLEGGEAPCRFPAMEQDGALYFPVEYAMQAAGNAAVYRWSDHTYGFTAGDRRYRAYMDGRLYDEDAGALLLEDFEILIPYSEIYTLLYCRGDQLEALFSVKWEYDGSTYRILQ